MRERAPAGGGRAILVLLNAPRRPATTRETRDFGMAMKRSSRRGSARRRLPLSVRLSLLVLFAALLPLAAVVGINDYTARDKLVAQGTQTLTNDARAKADLINTYMHERLLDGAALASLPTTPAYLACLAASQLPYSQAAPINAKLNCLDDVLGTDFYKGSNQRALAVGLVRDANYTSWNLYAAKGDALLTCVPSKDPQKPCGDRPSSLSVAPANLQAVQKGKQFVSDVTYDKAGNATYANLYTPIAGFQQGQVLGFLQARLKLDYIWNIVKGEAGANGSGSSAFIADANGTHIADASVAQLFSTTPDPAAVMTSLKSQAAEESFQGPVLGGGATTYQYVRIHLNSDNTPGWTYFVLSPLPTVTAVADDQVRISLLSGGVVALLAILIGLMLGRSMARPVHAATEDLQGAAASLKVLAARQESSASEQQWVVDACKTGLDSVRYLSDAMNQAAKRVIDASNWFGEYWDRLTEEQARRTVQHLQELARYIDEAARRQNVSSERMGKAITVTTQVSEQLVAGASAAKQSSDQLEEVVGNLQHVVGGRPPALAPELEQADELDMVGRIAVSPAPMRSGRSGRLEMGPPQGQMRQLAAPMSGSGRSGPGRSGPGHSQISPGSQMDPWGSGGRAPQAPYGPYAGARRPGQSQMFDGGGPSYPGPDYGGGYGQDNGGYGGYGQELPAGRRSGNPGSRVERDW